MSGNGRRPTILVIEDDRSLREGLSMNFSLQGYRVVTAADGEEGLAQAFDARPDVIVLDLMLPGLSGLEILAELRARTEAVPVLILSARGKTSDKVEGLRLGADDYLGKPFELPELLARVEVLLRRRRGERDGAPAIRFGTVEVDPRCRRVAVAGGEVALSAKEFDLLLLLARAPGRPFTREQILEQVWGWGFEGTVRTVDNFIRSLRQKIEADPANPRHLQTVRQVGYKLER
ncbi:MAG: response regulator transcription factor [Deltaproteobacteria bacterium]|nr:response regulator transcription factor [Deltaproteobacteria bacterium]